jgi:hypothetical protein
MLLVLAAVNIVGYAFFINELLNIAALSRRITFYDAGVTDESDKRKGARNRFVPTVALGAYAYFRFDLFVRPPDHQGNSYSFRNDASHSDTVHGGSKVAINQSSSVF